MKPIIRYFSGLRQLFKLDPGRRQRYLLQPHRNFIRNSPLTFQRTVCLINRLVRKSLAVVLARFFHWNVFTDDTATKSAFSQRRKLIKPRFFQDFFAATVQLFYRCFPDHLRWKGKRVFGVDGTGQGLPRFERIGQAFGFHLNQHDRRPSTRILATFDVLNKIIYRIDFHGQDTAEIVPAYQNVAGLPTDAIYIYDQHYASFGLAWLHYRAGSDFVIRMPLGGANIVKEFVKSEAKEVITEAKIKQGRSYRKLCELGLEPELHAEVPVRLVRVELDDGTIEVLMTSLLDRKKYSHAEFKDLYHLRWGIETSFLVLKSFLQLALVSATTQPGVEQDLWASFAFFNQQSALVYAADEAVRQQTGHRQHEYRINRNVTAGLLRDSLGRIYLGGPNEWRAKTLVLLKQFPKYTEAYRPNRDQERLRKHMRANDRHIHQKNYANTF